MLLLALRIRSQRTFADGALTFGLKDLRGVGAESAAGGGREASALAGGGLALEVLDLVVVLGVGFGEVGELVLVADWGVSKFLEREIAAPVVPGAIL